MALKGEIKDKTGSERHNLNGSLMIVSMYRSYGDIDVYFPEYNYYKYNCSYSNFKIGGIKSPYCKSVHGVGFIGKGKYTSRRI